MNKEQIDEIAMRVWNESESECDSITGRLVITEFTHALLAELAKVQEPIGWYTEEHLTDKSATTYNKEIAKRWVDKGWPVLPLYANPPPQPDLVAEIERLKVLSVNNIMLDVVPGDGSGKEVYAKSVDEVVKALTQLSEKAEDLFSTERRLESYIKEAEKLRQQLSAAQASEGELLSALETLACLGNVCRYGSDQWNAIAQKAITTHKTRKEGK